MVTRSRPVPRGTPMFSRWGAFVYRFRRPVALIAIVIALSRSTTPGADAKSAEFQGAIKTSIAGLSAVPEVTGVVGYAETGDSRFISTAGDAAYIVVELNVTDEQSV